ncbi:MAG: carboxypeptidase-like regulatory domain-containing protein [Flavobacterium sp.]|nr:carboxypeptidase-like regulatory domain-containing protein [Flavobacterium sp.]
MKKTIALFLFVLFALTSSIFAQTKVSGIVVDKSNRPVPFANIAFQNSTEGVVSNEDGLFYLESPKTYKVIVVTSVGFSDKEIVLEKSVTYKLTVQLSEVLSLNEVVIYSGKTSKKNNPALDILRKIWERRRKNGLHLFRQYQMEKYEKVEFDLNTIDSAYMKKKLFKGMEFIFNQVDTSKITGKTYLPIFINEALSDVYGDNQINKVKVKTKANKTSGFNGNQQILAFVDDLYSDFDIYDNHLTFFDKSFTSPLSKTGIDVYNYVLRDSSFIDDKWCYNIVFYPRRKNELTFKGDFWVSDTTFAIKNINMAATKSANINWVKDIYIEQEFEVMNDSVFLLTKDYMMTDFALNKKDKSKGIYGKRTTFYRDHKFNIEKPEKFYKEEVNYLDKEVYNKSEDFWEENRFEKLTKDEKGVYKMLDTLQTVKKFQRLYSLVEILDSGYINYNGLDFGPIYAMVGQNSVEGLRLRTGLRTYFGPNDPWRLQSYIAYGFKDDKIKYGVTGKWMVNDKKRIILSAGNRRDIEQIGASLTTTNDVLGRNYASSGLITVGSNNKLTNVSLSNVQIEIEPIKNLTFATGVSYKTLISASPEFSLDYYTDLSQTTLKSQVKQSEVNLQVEYTPNKKPIAFGVERDVADSPYTTLFMIYSQGFKNLFSSDFDYKKLQLYYKQPIIIGPLGRSNVTVEMGKTFGYIPLGLMSVVPGNQSLFDIANTFSNLQYYEFVADQYVTFKWDHDFHGRFFGRIPFMRKLNWRENIGFKSVYGTVSDENRMINASGLVYNAPEKVYWEYSAGIGNIFKFFRVDFSWRGNYLEMPTANKFAVKVSLGFYF